MRRPSPMRGGDEGDLLKQIILLESLAWLTPTQGEFWYLESHTGEGRSVADTPALDWYSAASAAPTVGWESYPLWHMQQHSLAAGEYLGSSALALHKLSTWESQGINVRWVFSPTSHERSIALQEICERWSANGMLPFHRPAHKARMLQLFGGGIEALQELVYLGGARAPGLALLEPPALAGNAAALFTLIETLVLRRFWVILVLPVPMAGIRATTKSSHYVRLYEGVEQLQIEGCRFVLDGRSSGWRPGAQFETWLLAPCGDLSELRARIWDRLVPLYGEVLGHPADGTSQDGLDGLDVQPFHNRPQGLASFQAQFPFKVHTQLTIDQAIEADLPDIIVLWEQLMDEHATFDEHFRRRPLARLYLRHSLSSQLNQPEYLLLVIRYKREVIGFLSAQILRAPLFHESRIGQIVDVFIKAEWRNQQLGGQLVQFANQWFLALKIKQIDLNVAVHNEQGRTFWERQGFQPYLHVVSKEIV